MSSSCEEIHAQRLSNAPAAEVVVRPPDNDWCRLGAHLGTCCDAPSAPAVSLVLLNTSGREPLLWAPAIWSALQSRASLAGRTQRRTFLARACSRLNARSPAAPAFAASPTASRRSPPGGPVLPSVALSPRGSSSRYFCWLPWRISLTRIGTRPFPRIIYINPVNGIFRLLAFCASLLPFYTLPALQFAHRQPKSFELVATSVGYGQGRGEAWQE